MNNDSNDSELIHLATLKLTGEGTPEDLAKLDQLIATNEANRSVYDELTKTWEGTGKVSGITQEEVNKEWIRLKNAMLHSTSRRSSFSFMKIAASIALLVVAGLALFFITRDNQTTILAQQIKTEVLLDGSSVTLNASSELRFSPDFGTSSREVSLQGEAFFDVERDESKPFIIHTSSLDVEVLGTSFNIRAIEDESTSEVVVVTGSVQVSYGGKSIRLEPNEKGLLDKSTGQLYKTFNDNVNFMAWKTKEFIFDDVLLKEVVRQLNQAYQSDLYLSGNAIQECPVTVSFDNQSLDSIIEVLKVTINLDIRETANGTEISGSGC